MSIVYIHYDVFQQSGKTELLCTLTGCEWPQEDLGVNVVSEASLDMVILFFDNFVLHYHVKLQNCNTTYSL